MARRDSDPYLDLLGLQCTLLELLLDALFDALQNISDELPIVDAEKVSQFGRPASPNLEPRRLRGSVKFRRERRHGRVGRK